MTALEWAAEHARELEADPARLVVGGSGAGAALAAAAALAARDHGWPPIARQLPDLAGAVDESVLDDLARSLRGTI
jgi:acetyl esterase/lipase